MRSKYFIERYKFQLLQCILKDKDMNLKLYHNFNELEINYNTYNSNINNKIKPRLISDFDLKIYCNYLNDKYLSSEYIFTANEIDLVVSKNGNLNHLSSAGSVLWSDSLIEKYKDYWNWKSLSKNPSIYWTEKLIYKYCDLIDFTELSFSINNQINYDILKKFEDRWDWSAISGNHIIIKRIEYHLNEFKGIVWNSLPYSNGYGELYKLELVSRQYGMNKLYCKPNIKPSISTNQGIEWDIYKYKNYKAEYNVDLWLIALFGKFNGQFVKDLSDLFNENRFCYTNLTKHSDWNDSHPVYRNGWENLFSNPNTIVDLDLLKYLSKLHATLIRHSGDARIGHTKYESTVMVSKLIQPENLKLTFNDLCENLHLLSDEYVSRDSINKTIFQNIIKPAFLIDNYLFALLAKVI